MNPHSSFDHWKGDDLDHAALVAKTDQLRAAVADEVNKGRLVFACSVTDDGDRSHFESISIGSASTPELLMFATTVLQMANKLLQDVLGVVADEELDARQDAELRAAMDAFVDYVDEDEDEDDEGA